MTMPMHKIIVFAILLTMMCGTIQGITSGPHSQRKVRQAAVAGQFYSADHVKLKADVAAAFRANAAVRPVDGVQAVIVPHAGYVFSARVAAAAYAAIAPTARYERIILLYNEATYETADVMSSFVYRQGILGGSYSYGATVDLFNGVINLVLLAVFNGISRRVSEISLW